MLLVEIDGALLRIQLHLSCEIGLALACATGSFLVIDNHHDGAFLDFKQIIETSF